MGVDLLLTALVVWLAARDPRLVDVCPHKSRPGETAPYCTYKVLTCKPSYHLKGPAFVADSQVRLEIWDTDHARAWSIASKLAGTKADPGLAGFKGLLTNSPKIWVQCGKLIDGGDAFDPEDAGNETGWYTVIQDYSLTFETEPRE